MSPSRFSRLNQHLTFLQTNFARHNIHKCTCACIHVCTKTHKETHPRTPISTYTLCCILGIDGRHAFVLLSPLIKVNERRVCVCVSRAPSLLYVWARQVLFSISLSLSLFDRACRLVHPGSLVNMAILSSN